MSVALDTSALLALGVDGPARAIVLAAMVDEIRCGRHRRSP